MARAREVRGEIEATARERQRTWPQASPNESYRLTRHLEGGLFPELRQELREAYDSGHPEGAPYDDRGVDAL